VQNIDSSACEVIFREINQEYPYYTNISVVRTDGSIFASSIPFSTGINLADRKHTRSFHSMMRVTAAVKSR
jgi:hypothetical protein